jgi:hypothetical protein
VQRRETKHSEKEGNCVAAEIDMVGLKELICSETVLAELMGR